MKTLLVIMMTLGELIFQSVSPAAYPEEARVAITCEGSAVDSFMGVDSCYVTEQSDSGKYCCAEYVSRFYLAVYGAQVYNINTVDGRPSVNVEGHCAQLVRVLIPRAGDIMQTKQRTHAAIVKGISDGKAVLIEQNYKWQDADGNTLSIVNRRCCLDENYFYRLYVDGKPAQAVKYNKRPAVSFRK